MKKYIITKQTLDYDKNTLNINESALPMVARLLYFVMMAFDV